MIKQISTIEEFNTEMDNIDNRYIILDFYTSTCNPCKLIFAQLDIIESELSDDILILKIDAEHSIDLVSMFNVMSVPTLFFYNNGELVNQAIGYIPVDMTRSKLFVN